MNKQSILLTVLSITSVLLILLSIVFVVMYFLPPFGTAELGVLFVYCAIGCAVVGISLLIVCVCKYVKQDAKVADEPTSEVEYIPSEQVYQFINMGKYQSVDEKFDQISQMDKTQFVIYIAQLFSRKGYQVKLTPVIDNFGIDLLVEKLGNCTAVSCLPASKVLSAVDINYIKEGAKHYQANGTMALTNMYFDRTASDYAKSNRITLFDRNVIAEKLMK